MAGYTDTSLNSAADAIAVRVTHISLHTADPGTTGINEVTGGTPAYARKVPTYGAAVASVADITGSLVFDVPATTVSFYGLWATAVFLGGFDLTDEVFAGQGTYTLTSAAVDSSNPV